MRKIISLMAGIVLITFTACEKEVMEEPGNIPGMGDAVGELQADPFELPEGIEIVGSIGGIGDSSGGEAAVSGSPSLKSTLSALNSQSYACYGSGGRWVKVAVTLKNSSNMYRTVFLPRGLLFKVNKEGYQHAMLLQWTWVCIKPMAERTFVLNLYCINRGLSGSDPHVEFSILGITNSDVMWSLLRLIGWRKINLEHYQVVSNVSGLKASADDIRTYEEITEVLQDAIWSLTDGTGLTEEQISFIESIPLLEEGSYPKALDDKTVEPPYYFDEYSPIE